MVYACIQIFVTVTKVGVVGSARIQRVQRSTSAVTMAHALVRMFAIAHQVGPGYHATLRFAHPIVLGVALVFNLKNACAKTVGAVLHARAPPAKTSTTVAVMVIAVLSTYVIATKAGWREIVLLQTAPQGIIAMATVTATNPTTAAVSWGTRVRTATIVLLITVGSGIGASHAQNAKMEEHATTKESAIV